MSKAEELKSGVRMRPRFRLESTMSPEEIGEAIRAELKREESMVRGTVITGHIELSMKEQYRKPWSPILTLEIIPGEEGRGSIVKGLYGPAPGIWTLFMFLYITGGFSIFILLFWGLAYYSLDRPAPMLWGIIPALLLLFGLWLSAKTGQRLSSHQIDNLHETLTKALNHSPDDTENAVEILP